VTSALTYLDNGEIEKAWQTIQVAEKNEKTANYYKTYYAKGRILQKIGESKDPKIKNLVDEPLKKAWKAIRKQSNWTKKVRSIKPLRSTCPC